jgi:cold shock CspA family protein
MTVLRAREVLDFEGDFEELQGYLFDNPEAFYLAAYCSNGIPRRFWRIMKLAYDSNSGKVLINGVDSAIHEIANKQIFTYGELTEDDITLTDGLIDRLSSKNINIRRKNNQRKEIKNPIPQNIYFSVNRMSISYLNRMVKQGVVHDKSRMRTLRRRAMQPMYSVDIALAYSFRVVPPKSLTYVMRNDIPKCPINDFNQAPEIKPARIISSFHGKTITPEEAENRNRDSLLTTGVIKKYEKDRFGSITLDINGKDIFFSANNVNKENKAILKSGDRVKFIIKQKTDNLQEAVSIELLTLPIG